MKLWPNLQLNTASYTVIGSQQDGQVAERDTAWSPTTQAGDPMLGSPNIQLFQTGSYPERDDGPQWSIEQGFGKPPGREWAHMPHVMAFSDDTVTNIAWHDGHGSVQMVPAEERHGWALPGPGGGPTYYYGNSAAQHVVGPEPIIIQDPGRMPYQDLAQVPA